MIEFKKLTYKNFLSAGNAETTIDFEKSKTTLIIGANGSGKSTMMDALSFSLFGSAFRNIKKSQMVNSINGKGTLVTLTLSADGHDYKIVRGIKPDKFEITIDGEIQDKKSVKEQQEEFEQNVIKMNKDSFGQIIVLGSATYTPFMEMGKPQRRKIIEDILDISIFTKMSEILKAKIKLNNDELTSITDKIEITKRHIDEQNIVLEQIERAQQNNDDGLKLELDEKTNKVNELIKENEKYSEKLKKLEEKLLPRKELKEKHSKVKDAKSTLEHKLRDEISTKSFLTSHDTCPTCNQPIDEVFKTDKLNSIDFITGSIEEKIHKCEDVITKINTKEKKFSEIQDLINKVNSRLSSNNSDIRNINSRIDEINKKLYSEVKDTTEAVNAAKNVIKKSENDIQDFLKVKEEKLNIKEIQVVTKSLLTDSGIKTTIINKFIPVINHYINEYLKTMNAYIYFELDDEFNEVVKSRYRDDFSYASFSEGEKMRINLAVLFTWRQIAKLVNSVNTNLLILDEIFDSSLDTNGTDEFMDIINNIEGNTHVFVISHKKDEFIDKFESVVQFEKVNEFSIMK